MNDLKNDLFTVNKILSKYVYEYDSNVGKINPRYIKDDKLRFPVSMAHRNIEFALNYLIGEQEKVLLDSEIKSMRSSNGGAASDSVEILDKPRESDME